MSNHFIPEKYAKTIEVPVRIRKGNKIEFFYEGELPDIQEGTLCRLIVPAHTIKEHSRQQQLSAEKQIPFLPKGSVIFMAVNVEKPDKVEPGLLKEFREVAERLRKTINNRSVDVLVGNGPVKIILQQDLLLTLRGTKRAKLEYCRCEIPLLKEEAISLNQAYSLVSQVLEKHRASHTGSAFRSMYHYDPATGNCISLEHLRNHKEAEDERDRLRRKKTGGLQGQLELGET